MAKCIVCKGYIQGTEKRVFCDERFLGFCNKGIQPLCDYFSPECQGQNHTNCGYWDGKSKCEQEGIEDAR